MINPLLPLSLVLFAATSLATSDSPSRTVRTTPALKAAGVQIGGGSECLWGCEGTDGCITNDRYKMYSPHSECRFSWMPYNCTPNGAPVWCNRIYQGCANHGVLLDETTSSPCGKPKSDQPPTPQPNPA